MNLLLLILLSIIFVTCCISAYLIGYSKGKSGQKEIIKYIYKHEEKPDKKKGFASKEEENITIKKRYGIN